MSRREARDAALAFLFQLDFRKEPISEQRELYLQGHPLDDEDVPFFDALVNGVCEKRYGLFQVFERLETGSSSESRCCDFTYFCV